MNEVLVKAPAKLNLSLDITGLQDGYHILDTVMQAVNLFEFVQIKKSRRISISCDAKFVPQNAGNIAYKAAVEFFKNAGLLAGAEISIKKNIPVRGGMAGGSADAAAVLYGLNALYGAGFTLRELCTMGKALGADIPFMLTGATARVSGIGDIIAPLPPFTNCHVAICAPQGAGVSTQRAFAAYDAKGGGERPNNNALQLAIEEQNLRLACDNIKNVLEYSSENIVINEQIKAVFLQNRALAAAMTGTGCVVFGVFEQGQQANKAAEHAAKYGKTQVLQPYNGGPSLC